MLHLIFRCFYGLYRVPQVQHNISQIQGLCTSIKHSYTRAVLRVIGDEKWCMQILHECVSDYKDTDVLWLSNTIENALPPCQARTKLGCEYRAIIFDCRDQFDLDALGAVSGTLCGGGFLCLIMPDLNHWDLLKNSHYLKMIRPLFEQHDALYCLQQGQTFNLERHVKYSEFEPYQNRKFLSHDQQLVVEKIEKNIIQNNTIPMVLLADRGRGKSSALGLAAGGLIKQGIKKILITAPRLSICECIFMQAQKILSPSVFEKNKLTSHTSSIEFKAPDALLDELPLAELLIVDEAAAIPLPLLTAMLKHYPNIIFSSTVYGYEGTGRGFELKFKKILDRLTPAWQSLSMQSAIRWAPCDPLETWINEILCLHTPLNSLPDINRINHRELSLVLLNKNNFINDPQQRNDLFSLLVSAHYRTRPSDFQYLLDQPQVRIYMLYHHQQMLAAVVINQEGGFDAALATAIYRGERRPQGHLLAQTLCFHAGVEAAACCTYGRIMRIAVHPDVQLKGLGSYLIQAIIEEEKNKVDMLGSSFAASTELLDFWHKQGFEIVRMGFTRDHVSASYSAVMLLPLANKKTEIFLQLRAKFQHSIGYWLDDILEPLQTDIKQKLLKQSLQDDAEINECDWQDIKSFAFYHRGFEACSPALNKLVAEYADHINELDIDYQEIIRCKIMQKNNWKVTVKERGLTGKKHALKQLREAITQLLNRVC